MADAFANWLRRQGNVAGIISAGGSGGASLVAPAMRALPVGVPKLIISSVASGDVGPYVGPADITMMYSVTDVQGLNSISRAVLANGANAIAGMVKARLRQSGQTRAQRAGRSAGGRHHHVRRDDAGRAEDRGRPAQRFRMPRLPRHRRRRPLDGEAGRFRHARRRHRSHDDGSLRSPDGRRVSRPPKIASARSSAAACPSSALSARSTWSISARRTRFPSAIASANSTFTIRR